MIIPIAASLALITVGLGLTSLGPLIIKNHRHLAIPPSEDFNATRWYYTGVGLLFVGPFVVAIGVLTLIVTAAGHTFTVVR